jgi:carboxyl-terminal processing protease
MVLVPILGIIFLTSGTLNAQNPNKEKEKVLITSVVDVLKEWHYEPLIINDAFSVKVYDLYLKRLDSSKRFFTQVEIKKLEKYRTKLDDEVLKGESDFLNLSINLFDEKKELVRKYYKEILAQPFDFKTTETFETNPEKLDFSKNDKELRTYWYLTLKYQTMARLAELLEEQEIAQVEGGKSDRILTYQELEEEARKKVLKIQDDWFSRMDKIDREDRFSTYLNAIAGAYDPHTNYFPPQEKENFDISMSGRLEGIGARLQEDGRYVKVVSIVPGSPSDIQGELEVGDKVMSVAQGKAEPVNAIDMPIDDVVSMIRGEKGTEVRLTVKKRDNSTKVIAITRDVIVLEESYAKSAILEKGGQKIGYIYLPKFYSDFQKDGGRRCATDVKDELTKLKKENVNAVILDLRNNGGGSLADVVEMGGLFVDKGPIVQVKQRNRQARVLEDEIKGVHYDGKLIIMVNAFSASASEILAAAMQDYNRAVIVGSSPTFGKGTVQQFFDLDKAVSSYYNGIKPLGSIKLTTQKFYRINGGTTQLQGVVPDIIIPDDYTYLEIGEKEEDFPLGWDEIAPATYSKTKINNFEDLKAASKKRVSNDALLNAVDEEAKKMKTRRENTVYSLNIDDYRTEVKRNKKEVERFEKLEKDTEGLNISLVATDLQNIGDSKEKQKRVEDWFKELKKDAQLRETLAIMNDML